MIFSDLESYFMYCKPYQMQFLTELCSSWLSLLQRVLKGHSGAD